LGVSQSVVSKHSKKSQIFTIPPKIGRPKVLDKVDERHISRMAVTGKATTAKDLVNDLKEYSNVKVSQNTILRTLKKSGVKSHLKIKKPLLNKGHRYKRRKFEKKYRHWDKYDWEYVVWSDETKINLHSNDARDRTFRKEGEPLRDHNVSQTKKFGGGSLMVWGCMLPCGVGCLCRIDGTIDEKLYRQILEDALLKSIGLYQLKPDEVIFQHDNAPSHSAKGTKKWLETNDISVLDWPPQSPDLNPIEHLWDHLKREIRGKKQCNNVNELWEVVTEAWDSIKPETCRKLVHSMPARLKEVRKSKGGFTSF
jgi:hypothetical protein